MKNSLSIKKLFAESDFLGNVVRLGSGTALGQILVVLSTPIITRLYNQTDMGILGIFVSFISFISVGITLRYELAIVSAQDRREADYLLTISLLITIPVSVLAGALMLMMIKYDLLSYGALPVWSSALTIFTLMGTGFFMSLRYWHVKQIEFKYISWSLIAQGAGRATIPVFLGLINTGWVGLIIGEVAGRLLGIGILFRKAWSSIKQIFLLFDKAYCTKVIRQYWKFPAVILPSSLVNALAATLPLPVISTLFGINHAGQFLLVSRIAMLPSGLISASIADVLHARLAEVYQKSPYQVRSVLWKTTKKLIVIGLIIYLPIAVASPFVFEYFFGKQWSQAGILVTILIPLVYAGLVVSPLSRMLLLVDHPEIKLIGDMITLIFPLLALLIFSSLGYDFLPSILGYSLTQTMASLIYFLLIWRSSG